MNDAVVVAPGGSAKEKKEPLTQIWLGEVFIDFERGTLSLCDTRPIVLDEELEELRRNLFAFMPLTRRLLQYLLDARGHVVKAEELYIFFWPGTSKKNADYSLRNQTTHIRKVTSRERLIARIWNRPAFGLELRGEHEPTAFFSISQTEVKLLRILIARLNTMIPFDDILTEVWGPRAGNLKTHRLETHIWRLRRHLEQVEIADCLRSGNSSYGLYSEYMPRRI